MTWRLSRDCHDVTCQQLLDITMLASFPVGSARRRCKRHVHIVCLTIDGLAVQREELLCVCLSGAGVTCRATSKPQQIQNACALPGSIRPQIPTRIHTATHLHTHTPPHPRTPQPTDHTPTHPEPHPHTQTHRHTDPCNICLGL